MFFRKLIIILAVFISISPKMAFVSVSDDCMRTYDWNSKSQSKEEKKVAAECINNELLKRGYQPCNYKCLEKLSLEEQKQRLTKDIEQTAKVIAEEMARRKTMLPYKDGSK